MDLENAINLISKAYSYLISQIHAPHLATKTLNDPSNREFVITLI